MFKQLVKLLLIVLVAVGMQIGANNLADMERGYEAMGSEVFVFQLIVYGGYSLFLREEEQDV